MMLPLLGVLLSSSVSAIAETDGYEISLRGETSAVPVSASLVGPVGANLQLDPSGTVRWTFQKTRLSATYAPNLYVLDLAGSRALDASQHALVIAEIRLQPEMRLTLGEEARYGVYNFGSLVSPVTSETPTVTPIPTTGPVYFLYSNTHGAFELDPQPRAHLRLEAAYLISGGADAAARLQLPLGLGPIALARFGYDVSPTSTLETTAQGSDVFFSTNDRIDIVAVIETWRWRATPLLEADFGGGVGGVRWQQFGGPTLTFPVPEAQLSLAYGGAPDAKVLHFGATARFGPFLDWLYAGVYPRVETFVWLAGAFVERWGFGVRGGAAAAVFAGRYAGTVDVLGELNAAYRLSEDAAIEMGFRMDWERMPVLGLGSLPSPSVNTYLGWITFAGARLGIRGVL